MQGPSPLPVHDAWGSFNWTENGVSKTNVFTYPIFRQLQAGNRTLGPIVGFKNLPRVNLTVNGVAQSSDAQLVSGGFYSALEVNPQLGRPLLPSDDGAPGTGTAAVLSDSFWRRAFGASRSVLGRSLTVNGTIFTIVGVNPRGFTGAQSAQISPEVFLPLSALSNLHEFWMTRVR